MHPINSKMLLLQAAEVENVPHRSSTIITNSTSLPDLIDDGFRHLIISPAPFFPCRFVKRGESDGSLSPGKCDFLLSSRLLHRKLKENGAASKKKYV